MGTDIHIYVEECVDGEWHQMLGPYKSWSQDRRTWSPWHEHGLKTDLPDPTDRQYTLFAFLADVRNGSGFAGVRTHQVITPQFPHRGIPTDTSYEEDENMWLGDHSYTYAYLNELLEAPWDLEFHSQGTVNYHEYENWKNTGMPNSWSGGVSGGSTRHWSNEEFQERIDKGEITPHDYTVVHWKWQPLLNCGFHRWIVETLLPVVDDPSAVRVLMGFDN